MTGRNPVVKVAKWLAAFTALVIAFGPPLGFLYFGYRLESTAIETRTDLLSLQLTQLINANPDYWQFETIRLDELLKNSDLGGADGSDRHRVFGATSDLVTETRGSNFSDGWPTVTHRKALFDYGAPVGTIEITESLKALYLKAASIGVLSLIVGTLVFLGLRILPVRSLQRAWDRIAFLASHDAMTRLPNRVLFMDRLTTAIAGASRRGQALTVHSLDIDHFKDINDTLGHAAGDTLLRQFVARVSGCLRQGDTLARLSGDEFAIIQTGTNDAEAAVNLAKRVIAAVEQPFDINGQEAIVGISIGMAMTGADGHSDPQQLLKQADLALYKSKGNGRNTYHFFEEEMDAELQSRKALEVDLRKALHAEDFRLFYQPQIDLASQRIVGLEALLRWHHPVRGDVPPEEFIRVAEGTGLIIPLSEWVLRTACREALPWAPLSVAVNLSPLQFQQRGLVAMVERALAETGLPASRLELEITEEILLNDTEHTLDVLNRLRALGVRIAMDDFGIGYSSLGYLRRFPFDKIKIDRSFVADLNNSSDAQAIVRAIIGLSQALNIHINAEGVETLEQANQLMADGCQEVQGFLYGAPMSNTAISDLVTSLGILSGADDPALKAAS
ncbi:putative bifunctional diguanylate cyclase/phosphodiesterase [Bauldia litoralis]|uniref:putative bifunctional diguanylate cyclase/phosphodiesterase n=1 Tax=Bauldia litoralis TaxID=665467 RepID=UPI0032664755